MPETAEARADRLTELADCLFEDLMLAGITHGPRERIALLGKALLQAEERGREMAEMEQNRAFRLWQVAMWTVVAIGAAVDAVLGWYAWQHVLGGH